MFSLYKKSIHDAIASQNTIHGSVTRFNGMVVITTIGILAEFYAVIPLVIFLLIIFPSFAIYLAIKFNWMRVWLAIMLVLYVTCTSIAFQQMHNEYWWLFWLALPFIFSIPSHLYFDKYLRRLGTEYGVPRELDDDEDLEDDERERRRQGRH